MFSGNLNPCTIHNILPDTIPLIPTFLTLILVEILMFHTIIRICMFFRGSYQFLIQSHLQSFDNLDAQEEKKNQDFEFSNQQSSSGEKKDDGNLCREDVERVMGELGIFCHPDAEKLPERLSSSDLSNLFEEEPSFDEVKEAFDVFDENRDGFIDAGELQRVLRVLGFKDGAERENCRRMIATFDENGDGRIDFKEFVKFMENSLC